jgi:serine/threonine protein kinase
MENRDADRIFQDALDLPATDREKYCRERCGNDTNLLTDVLELLALDPGTTGQPFGEAPLRLGPADRQLDDPERIGHFRILQRLGAGGFGVVYEAEQLEPIRRRIALKVLKAGMDTEDVLARFDAERQALALMDHPNIARVLDVGATEQGRPWFAMELVRGEPITRYADDARLSIDDRIELFVQVCRAVQHAHQKGIIHRDLKPSNLLVARIDGTATPKVIDFGIAKAVTTPLVDRTLRTVSGSVMGTPTYMSPEQAGVSRLDVDTSTDVYSLGVVLYELLCGQLPVHPDEFSNSSPAEFSTVIRNTRRRPPSERVREVDDAVRKIAAERDSDPWALRATLRDDLDWITMRAIASDRERRYQTVQQFEQELQRYRASEPVEAGPPSVRYRLGKFARRHRVELGVAAALFVMLNVAGAGLTWGLINANREKAKADRARAEAEAARTESEVVVQFLSDMLAAPRPVAEGRDVTVAEVLDQALHDRVLDFPDQPAVEARLRTVIGSTYRELGRTDEALEQLEASLALQNRTIGPSHPATLETRRSLGLVYREMGDYPGALEILAPTVEGFRGLDPPDSIALARALECLGSVWLLDEKPDQARPYLEEAYAIARATLPPENEIYGSIVSDLGLVWTSLSNYEKAEPFLQESYRIDMTELGPEHPQTLVSAQNLGSFYRETGRVEEAIPLYELAYRNTVKNLGTDHPSTLRTRNNYALVLSDAGSFDEARIHAEGVVASRERDLGPDVPPTIASRINLALLYHRMGDDAAADPHIRETIERCRRAHGPDHLYTLIAEGLLGEILVTRGQATEALPLLESTVSTMEEVRGGDHWRTAHIRVTLGQCLIDLGRPDEARIQLVAARAVLAANYPEDHARVIRADGQLARID